MKYGLLYYKNTDNIGDDIQTYAAKRFLPHIDYYVDRENLNCFVPKEKEYVSIIMNAWYLHNKCAWPPSPYINPLLISMHFTSLESIDVGEEYLKGLGGDYLRKYGKIGARDNQTKKRLENNGVDSYFSGCMTLTLNKYEGIEKKDKIIMVDVSEKVEEKVRDSTKNEIEILTHWLNPEEVSKKDISERMKNVEELLKKYQEAHLVITSRLHVALPCVSMGTPVILLHRANYEEDRLGTYIDFVDSYIEEDFLSMDIENLIQNPKINSDKYLEIRDNLINSCENFIKECEGKDFDINKLPDIKEYQENYVSKIEWYKDLYNKSYNNAKNKVFMYENKIKEIINDKDSINTKLEERVKELLTQNDKLLKEREDIITDKKSILEEKKNLELELDNIYNSRGWKYLQKIRKILNRKILNK